MILELLRLHPDGLTDSDIYKNDGVSKHNSPSGARTRRCELVDMGFVKSSGRTKTLPSGRESIVWCVAVNLVVLDDEEF